MVEESSVPEPKPEEVLEPVTSLDAPLPKEEQAVQDAAKEAEESEGEGVKSEPTGFDSDGRPTGVTKTD